MRTFEKRAAGSNFSRYCLVILLAKGRGGGKEIDLIDTVAMLNKSVFKTVSLARGEPLSVLISQTHAFLDEFRWNLLVKIVYSNDSVSWVGKVRVSTLDRLEKDDFSVSDTGDLEGKIPVLPIGVKPPWETPM